MPFQCIPGYYTPAPENFQANDDLQRKLQWYQLENITHTMGNDKVSIDEFDCEPRDLLANTDAAVIRALRQPNARLAINNVLESRFLRQTGNIYPHIHRMVDEHNLNPHHICYISSNLNEHKRYTQWCVRNNVHNRIQVYGVLGWWEFARNNFTQYTPDWRHAPKAKSFLCLNRRTYDAPHRATALYAMQHLGVINSGLISNTAHDNHCQPDWDPKTYRKSSRIRIIDVPAHELAPGQAADLDTHRLHKITAFSIVTESCWNTESGVHRFYTEKTLRAVLYGHPFVIVGEAGANTDLSRLGIEPYDELWDMGTEFETSVYNRVYNQMASVRWDWNPQDMYHTLHNKIVHNRNAVLKNTHNTRVFKQINRWALDA